MIFFKIRLAGYNNRNFDNGNVAASNAHPTPETAAHSDAGPSPAEGSTCTAPAERMALRKSIARSHSRTGNVALLTSAFTAGPPPAPVASICRDDAMEALNARFGAEVVASRLAHDFFADLAELKRQLNHETKTGITVEDYSRIEPFGGLAGIMTRQRSPAGDGQEALHAVFDPNLGP